MDTTHEDVATLPCWGCLQDGQEPMELAISEAVRWVARLTKMNHEEAWVVVQHRAEEELRRVERIKSQLVVAAPEST